MFNRQETAFGRLPEHAMLKITILTCAMITLPPVFEAAVAGDPAPAIPVPSVSPAWTGRFLDAIGAPAAGGVDDFRAAADNGSDQDIVGSIPPETGADPYVERMLSRGTQDVRLCTSRPASEGIPAGQDLACGGADGNRWSRKVEHFNYDLSAADMTWMGDLLSYPSPSVDP